MTPYDLYPSSYIDYLFESVSHNDKYAMMLLAALYKEGIVLSYYPEEAAWLEERAGGLL